MNNEHTSVRCSNATGIDVGFGSEEYFLDLATTCEKCHQDHGKCSVDCKWSHGPKGAKKCIHKNFSLNFFNLNHKMNFSSEESLEGFKGRPSRDFQKF